MAEAKTKPTDEDPRAFVAAIADDRRRADAVALLDLFIAATGEKPVMWGAAIVGFGTYVIDPAAKKPAEWPLVAFSPRKAAHSLYGMNAAADSPALLARLGRHDKSVGCLYIKTLADIDQNVLRELVGQAYAGMKARHA